MENNQFSQLGLSEQRLQVINEKGFLVPTEIQRKIIPLLLSTETDIIGQARTGTGKTAAFGIPMLEKLSPKKKTVQALVLVPTRELAIQVAEEINSLKGTSKLNIMPVYGGQSMPDQIKKLEKGVDIVVGTPGRIADHLNRKTLRLNSISFLVIDEADEMFNMGFIEELESILIHTSHEKRMLLFSATMPPSIMKIASRYMKEHQFISAVDDIASKNLTEQCYYEVATQDKVEALCRIIDIENDFYGLIFCRTKAAVDELAEKLIERGYDTEGLHGDFSQYQRELTLAKFRKKRINILVATDVAARGIDINDLSHVINYSIPQDSDTYTHRVGRTGRAGKKGVAITFVCPSERNKFNEMIRKSAAKVEKKSLPSVDVIINKRKSRIAARLTEIIDNKGHHDYIGSALQMLKDNDAVDIIAAMLHDSYSDQLDKSSYRDISPIIQESGEQIRLFASMGKKDGLNVRKLLKLVQNESRVSSGRIKEVTVKDSFSFFTVTSGDADIILKAFKKNRRNNIPTINRADAAKNKSKEKVKPKVIRKKKSA